MVGRCWERRRYVLFDEGCSQWNFCNMSVRVNCRSLHPCTSDDTMAKRGAHGSGGVEIACGISAATVRRGVGARADSHCPDRRCDSERVLLSLCCFLPAKSAHRRPAPPSRDFFWRVEAVQLPRCSRALPTTSRNLSPTSPRDVTVASVRACCRWFSRRELVAEVTPVVEALWSRSVVGACTCLATLRLPFAVKNALRGFSSLHRHATICSERHLVRTAFRAPVLPCQRLTILPAVSCSLVVGLSVLPGSFVAPIIRLLVHSSSIDSLDSQLLHYALLAISHSPLYDWTLKRFVAQSHLAFLFLSNSIHYCIQVVVPHSLPRVT